MTELIASQEVGNMLNTWNLVIQKGDLSAAIEMQDDIDKAIEQMEENQDILLYYQLLSFRLKLKLQNISKNLDKPFFERNAPDEKEEKTNKLMSYYFYFYNGIYHDYLQDYDKALSYFRIAEKKLAYVDDEIEKAEFHYKLAVLFYDLKMTFLSKYHAQIACDTFNAHESYIKRQINCRMLHALNLIDQFEYEKASELFNEAENMIRSINDNHLIIHLYYSMGFLESKRENAEKASAFFRRTLSYEEIDKQMLLKMRCLYELARIEVSNQSNEVIEWVDLGISLSEQVNHHIFQIKFKLLKELLYETNEIQQANISNLCAELEERRVWVDLEEILVDVAKYLEEKGLLQESLNYYKRALHASQFVGKGVN
ncbi:response regulator aspartate phosphatase [Bacillus safensis]|uniref:response regulator aspartate phosphatase n=1 Tax=Bacillus safensis TaxID=561879 RepID=UPI003982069A